MNKFKTLRNFLQIKKKVYINIQKKNVDHQKKI